MSKDALVLLGILVPALAALLVGWRQSSTGGQSAIAEQLNALGTRLDEVNERADALSQRVTVLERVNRRLSEYAYTLRRRLHENDIDVPEPPADLEL